MAQKRRKTTAKRRKKSRKRSERNRNLIGIGVVVLLVVVPVLIWVPRLFDSRPAFDGERAMAELVKQVEFGPRVPGSEAHQQAGTYLVETLQQYAERAGEHPFTYVHPRDSSQVFEGRNIIASFNLNPKVQKRVMLAAHWDSRPFADQDPDSANHTKPVPGANDGASGTAVLLELARIFAADPPDIGVDLVFFDLEDIGEKDDGDSTTVEIPFAIGSEEFAEAYKDYRLTYGILLDMVCDRNLRIPKEANSLAYARPVMDKIWAAAERVGATAFVDEQGLAVTDDHVAFLERGLRVADLIQTPFPSYWHTVEDTPDKCSAESLQQVGDVLIEVIYSE